MKLRDANLQVFEKIYFTYFPSCILSLFSKNDYFFRRGFESVRAKLLSGKLAKSSVTCTLPVQLRFTEVNFLYVECGIWRSLEYGFCQITWNLLEYKDYKNVLHLSACVFWYVLFDEKLVVLHHSDNAFLFLFWHLYQTQTFSNDLNDGEIITSHLMFEQRFIKQHFMIKISYKKHATWQNHFVIAKFKKLSFFQLNLVFIADSHTRLRSGLL